MELIDTHVHVIQMQRLRYPWLDTFEALRRDYTYAAWQTEALRCGITGALHMEVDVAENDITAETDMVEGFMAEPGSILKGIISSCRPESSAFPKFLESAIARKSIKGFRRVLHVMPDDLSTSTTFRDNIKRLSGTGLPFDLCVLPHQLPLAAALADHAPGVQFVLDHCGVPGVKDKVIHPWVQNISELAKRPNVAVKLSGISAYADAEKWTVTDLKPFVDHCLEAFGFDRIVWGGDWPVVTLGSSLSTWVAATHALLAGVTAEQKAKIFSINAKRTWKI